MNRTHFLLALVGLLAALIAPTASSTAAPAPITPKQAGGAEEAEREVVPIRELMDRWFELVGQDKSVADRAEDVHAYLGTVRASIRGKITRLERDDQTLSLLLVDVPYADRFLHAELPSTEANESWEVYDYLRFEALPVTPVEGDYRFELELPETDEGYTHEANAEDTLEFATFDRAENARRWFRDYERWVERDDQDRLLRHLTESIGDTLIIESTVIADPTIDDYGFTLVTCDHGQYFSGEPYGDQSVLVFRDRHIAEILSEGDTIQVAITIGRLEGTPLPGGFVFRGSIVGIEE